MADRAALMIAIETYFEAGPPRQYATSDCAELQRALLRLDFNPEKCLLIAGTRATKAALESLLRRLPKLIGKVDSLLVMLVTRGFAVRGSNYLVCADTLLADPTATAILLPDFLDALRKTKVPQTTLLLDVDPLPPGEGLITGVTAGWIPQGVENCLNEETSVVSLLAAAPDEPSFDSGTLRHGIWRHHLLEMFCGAVRAGVGRDGTLTAQALQAHLADAVPRTLRRTHETEAEQQPRRYGSEQRDVVVADLTKVLEPNRDLLDPTRMKRVVFRTESLVRMKDLSGYRKTQCLPDRANEWARKYVARIAAADIKADVDSVFDRIREQFGYKRKDLDVSVERDGFGYIRSPDFEYTVSLRVNPEEPSEAYWRREVGRLSGPEFIRSEGFQAVFGTVFDRLVFEFSQPVDVAEFVDLIEEAPPEGIKVSVASDAQSAEITLRGFLGKIHLDAEGVTIQGQAGNSATLLDQFLSFLGKFTGLGEPKELPHSLE